jgi:hypothetical protein
MLMLRLSKHRPLAREGVSQHDEAWQPPQPPRPNIRLRRSPLLVLHIIATLAKSATAANLIFIETRLLKATDSNHIPSNLSELVVRF